MTNELIKDKLRKLLAVAQNAGATEAEAATAMELAMRLMTTHGISQAELGLKSAVEEGLYLANKYRWRVTVAVAAAVLYGCQVMRSSGGYDFKFVGRPEHNQAAELTFHYICGQVDRLYAAAPKPLLATKAELSRFFYDFKEACALRLRQRAHELVRQLPEAVGQSKALVVQHRQQLQAEVADFLRQHAHVKASRSKALAKTLGSGAQAGYQAGNQVALHHEVA